MSDTTRAVLLSLYAAISACLVLPLNEATRRMLTGAARCLARDLGVGGVLYSEERRGRSEEERYRHE